MKADLVAGGGGAVIWPLLIVVAKAKELLITGDTIGAHAAERIGLMNKVVRHGLSMGTVMDLAKRLTNGPGLVIRGRKHAINKTV